MAFLDSESFSTDSSPTCHIQKRRKELMLQKCKQACHEPKMSLLEIAGLDAAAFFLTNDSHGFLAQCHLPSRQEEDAYSCALFVIMTSYGKAKALAARSLVVVRGVEADMSSAHTHRSSSDAQDRWSGNCGQKEGSVDKTVCWWWCWWWGW